MEWWKDFSEILKNFVEVLVVFAAAFAWWKWRRERHDRSIDVLFGLEKKFTNPKFMESRLLIEDDAEYDKIAPVLRKCVLAELAPKHNLQPSSDEHKSLRSLDELLRFYVFLHSVCEARQAPESALRASYRYWLTHYFHPTRTAFRAYVNWFYPTVSRWLQHDELRASGWRRERRFFNPIEYGWVGTEEQRREQMRRGIKGRVLVLTGAGISADSGIPTFRDSGGYWRKLNPRRLATAEAFAKDPSQVWEWYHARRRKVLQSWPNQAHQALVELALNCEDFLLVTQNVDDLHERAEYDGKRLNEKQIVHIHGRIFMSRCSCTRCQVEVEDRDEHQTNGIPMCQKCGGKMRPAVVWFDEENDQRQEQRVDTFISKGRCDIVLVIGTTATFDYIRRWALEAALNGGWFVEINPHETPLSRFAHHIMRARAKTSLPGLVHAAVEKGPLSFG
jgi:NAD-dependent deacetylase